METGSVSTVRSPLTNSEDVTLIKTIPTASLIDRWQSELGIDIHDQLHGLETIELYRCNTTGLEFFSPPEVAGTDELYARLQQVPWYYLSDKWEHTIAAKDLAGVGRILEIGCGSGIFVKQATDAGLDITGIELNLSAVEAARAKGLPVEYKSLQDVARDEPESFDAACDFQVLEHVPDPLGFLQATVATIKPGGIMIVSVPNADSFITDAAVTLDMPPHHMLRWSLKAFQSLEELFPLHLEKVRYEPLAPYHCSQYLRTVGKTLRERRSPTALLYNKPMILVMTVALKLGLRHAFRGACIYAIFRKDGAPR